MYRTELQYIFLGFPAQFAGNLPHKRQQAPKMCRTPERSATKWLQRRTKANQKRPWLSCFLRSALGAAEINLQRRSTSKSVQEFISARAWTSPWKRLGIWQLFQWKFADFMAVGLHKRSSESFGAIFHQSAICQGFEEISGLWHHCSAEFHCESGRQLCVGESDRFRRARDPVLYKAQF